ncbi:MAG: hypothetical protein WBX02_03475, partial [Terriglobales bacterium]
QMEGPQERMLKIYSMEEGWTIVRAATTLYESSSLQKTVKAKAALIDSAGARIRFVLRPTSAHHYPAFVQHFNQLVDDFQQ